MEKCSELNKTPIHIEWDTTHMLRVTQEDQTKHEIQNTEKYRSTFFYYQNFKIKISKSYNNLRHFISRKVYSRLYSILMTYNSQTGAFQRSAK